MTTNALPLPDSPASLLPLVLKSMSGTPNVRLRQLMASLTKHLHDFVLENRVTEPEFERAVDFLIGIGQATGPKTNEVILAADLFGVSTLVALLNNPSGEESADSHAALLGPFWRANAPACANGSSIVRCEAQGVPMTVRGRVFGADGRPLASAVVDVWQADPKGLYENQDPTQPDMNLRGRFETDAEGFFFFDTVTPAGYPVPTDGPCGELIAAQRRDPYRPAHLHFMVAKPGHKVLITQVFADDDERLASDPVFGVTRALVGRFTRGQRDGQAMTVLEHDFHLCAGEMVYPKPPIP